MIDCHGLASGIKFLSICTEVTHLLSSMQMCTFAMPKNWMQDDDQEGSTTATQLAANESLESIKAKPEPTFDAVGVKEVSEKQCQTTLHESELTEVSAIHEALSNNVNTLSCAGGLPKLCCCSCILCPYVICCVSLFGHNPTRCIFISTCCSSALVNHCTLCHCQYDKMILKHAIFCRRGQLPGPKRMAGQSI